MEKLPVTEMSMDMEVQSLSGTQYSETSVSETGILTVPDLQDLKTCKVSREVLTPLKLQWMTCMNTQEGPGVMVQKGESLELYRSWQCCVQNWMSISEKMVPVQGADWRLPVADKTVSEITQLQTYYLQELKKYVDSKLTELWSKLRDIWSGNLEYAKNMSQMQDKLTVEF